MVARDICFLSKLLFHHCFGIIVLETAWILIISDILWYLQIKFICGSIQWDS